MTTATKFDRALLVTLAHHVTFTLTANDLEALDRNARDAISIMRTVLREVFESDAGIARVTVRVNEGALHTGWSVQCADVNGTENNAAGELGEDEIEKPVYSSRITVTGNGRASENESDAIAVCESIMEDVWNEALKLAGEPVAEAV